MQRRWHCSGSNPGLENDSLVDTDVKTAGDGTVNKTIAVKVSVDPGQIALNSLLYSEGDTVESVTAQIRFCVRFGLYTKGAPPVEVNFLETVITLDVDLSDGFDIASVSVAPKDKLVRTAAQAYQVEGYVCDEKEKAVTDLAAIRNQGAQIRVCVRPDTDARADGIYMRAIDSFDMGTVLTYFNHPSCC